MITNHYTSQIKCTSAKSMGHRSVPNVKILVRRSGLNRPIEAETFIYMTFIYMTKCNVPRKIVSTSWKSASAHELFKCQGYLL